MTTPALFVALATAGFAITLTLWVAWSSSASTSSRRLAAASRAHVASELSVEAALTPRGWFGYWLDLYLKAGKSYSSPRGPGIVAAVIVVSATLFGLFVIPRGPLGVAIPALALFGWRSILGIAAKRRLALIDKQLPLLLSSLMANLHAGATPQQALLNVADEIPAPLGLEIQKLRQSVHVAVSLEDALKELSVNVPSREVAFLASSIEIAVKSGADLAPQLIIIDDIITQRTRLQSKMASAIAQSQPTKIVAIIATVFFGIVSFSNPAYQQFWASPTGIFALLMVAAFTGAGLMGFRILVKRVETT